MRAWPAVLLAAVLAAGCSPEATRNRGDAGADPGNRTSTVDLHGPIDPGHKTPQLGKAAERRAVAGYESPVMREK